MSPPHFGKALCFTKSKKSHGSTKTTHYYPSGHDPCAPGCYDKGGYTIEKYSYEPEPPCDLDCMVRTDKKSTCNLFLAEKAKTFKVTVTCEHDDDICVNFFGHPCEITPVCKQYVNSLGHQHVKGCSGSKATFTYETACFAACQTLNKPATHCQDTSICLQNCKIKDDKCDKTGDACDLHFDDTEYPVLSDPCDSHCVEDKCFEINTPFFCKDSCGEGISIGLGGIACKEYQMCSYVVAEPGTKYQLKPCPKIYVALGSCKKGECVDFSTHALEKAAVCDLSTDECEFNIVYTADCKWTVNGDYCY